VTAGNDEELTKKIKKKEKETTHIRQTSDAYIFILLVFSFLDTLI